MSGAILVLLALTLLLVSGAKARECPEGMVPTGTGTCIDRYEFPGKKGELPRIALSAIPGGNAEDLQEICHAQGKRLPTKEEWVSACKRVHEGGCNNSKKWRKPREALVQELNQTELDRLDQREPSGSSGCGEDDEESAVDMLGNVEEWVTCQEGVDGYCLMGRFWAHKVNCDYAVKVHAGAWHYYETGGRCVQD